MQLGGYMLGELQINSLKTLQFNCHFQSGSSFTNPLGDEICLIWGKKMGCCCRSEAGGLKAFDQTGPLERIQGAIQIIQTQG